MWSWFSIELSEYLSQNQKPKQLIDFHAIAFNGCDTQVIDVGKPFLELDSTEFELYF